MIASGQPCGTKAGFKAKTVSYEPTCCPSEGPCISSLVINCGNWNERGVRGTGGGETGGGVWVG